MFDIRGKMKRAWINTVEPLRREDGSVMMEAVIIMPLLAGFYCASFVWFDVFRQKTLTMKASYAVSDVLSRQSTVDEPFLDNMHKMLDYMIPSNARPRMRVSLISYNDDYAGENDYRLRWSYGPYGMPDLTQADLDKDVSWIPSMGDDEVIVVTETFVSYQPIFRVGIPDQIFKNVIVTRPRFHPTLDKDGEFELASNVDDEDDDGDGDPVGTETGADGGGDSSDGDGE